MLSAYNVIMNVWLKEKHLSLSRHYRKDFCNIFSNDERMGFQPCYAF